jgi:purine-binding chemotaxis protein CheW
MAKQRPQGDLAASRPAPEAGAEAQFIVTRVADEALGFSLGDVAEIIRLPPLAHMPLGPRSLLGLANLRGLVLPVVSLRRLIGLTDAPMDQAARVVVVDRGAPVGFVVDGVEALLRLPAAEMDAGAAGAGRIDPDFLAGVVKGREGESSIKILDPERLLRDQFARLGVTATRNAARVAFTVEARKQVAAAPQRQTSLVSFTLGTQEYALPVERVREIIPLPEHVSEVAGAETAVIGVVTLRGSLLPLVSLRLLLGLPAGEGRADRGKVVVVSMGKTHVGVVVDRTRQILRIDPAVVDPAPVLLTRGAGDAEIESICRLDDGERLVAVLSPDRLFRSELVRRVLSETAGEDAAEDAEAVEGAMTDEQFIIFRLAEQEYGLPITAVEEIARPPDRITRLPKAPDFIDGVINLRGRVVPIVDLRRRFELGPCQAEAGRRILVLAFGGGQTGFLVDGVSEVLKVPGGAISPAPEVSAEQMRLIGRVINLDAQGRLILVIDSLQLLDRVEMDMLETFDRTRSAPGAS